MSERGAAGKILVLGAGRVGAAIALDLAADGHPVTVADHAPDAVTRLEDLAARGAHRQAHGTGQRAARPVALHTAVTDLADPAALADLVSRHDLVVGALPGNMGFEALRRVIESGRDVVDISFFPEDPFALDAAARQRDVTAVVDAGVAPGLSNLVLGHLAARMDVTDRFSCMVGGLPVERRWPFEYKAPFSPADVIEEYTRPVRLRRGGRDRVLAALSEVELVDLPGVGTLEAFDTDGLRTLLTTVDAPEMVEKTLRYPGHAEKMRMLRETGFFAVDPVEVDGVRVRPLDVTSRLLFEAWRLGEDEPDLTVMRIEVEGREEGGPVRHVFELLDRYDPASGISSMARTTGYTCTALVRLVLEGRWRRPGVAPPELVGREEGVLELVLGHLAERGVTVERRRTP